MLYKLVRRVSADKPGKVGVAPLAVYRGVVDTPELCRMISARSILCESDVVQVIQALVRNAIFRLMNSEAFPLGPLGYLTTAIRTDQVKDPARFTHSNIRGAHVVFIPGPALRREMKKAVFCRVTEFPPIPRRMPGLGSE